MRIKQLFAAVIVTLLTVLAYTTGYHVGRYNGYQYGRTVAVELAATYGDSECVIAVAR